jgi:hypothetical protein
LDRLDDRLKRQAHPAAIFRTGILPVYNCHGLTFASRRTGIDLPESVWRILDEDGYTEVPLGDVVPGDVIVYISPEDGDVEHSGVVTEVKQVGAARVPWVCSKWGRGSEVWHQFGDCPYDASAVRFFRVSV